MSHQATTWVMEFSQSRLADRLVLGAIAHRISNDNGEAFPSIATIAREANVSESSVHASLKKLREIGELEVEASASRLSTNVYRMPKFLSWMAELHSERGGAKSVPPSKRPVCTGGVQNTGERGAKPAPEPSVTIIEPSGSAPSSPAVDSREQPRSKSRNGADQYSGNDFSKALKRLAGKKDLGHAKRSAGNPQLKHLEAGIFRRHVRSAYFDGRGDGHEKAFGYALEQAALSLTSNRARELRWIGVEELRAAAWAKLRPYVGAFAGIADYSRRQNQVVGAIVRVVAEVALALQTASESPHANRPREAVEPQSVAAVG